MRIPLALGAAVLSIGLGACATTMKQAAGHDTTTTTYGGTVAPVRADSGLGPARDSGDAAAVKAAQRDAVKPQDAAGVTAADSTVGKDSLSSASFGGGIPSVTSAWPTAERDAAAQMVTRLGEPSESSDTALVWRDAAPFSRAIVHHAATGDTSPGGIIELVITYAVPDSAVAKIRELEAGLTANPASGELSVRCDRRELCVLALNAANDVIKGGKSVQQARQDYAHAVQQVQAGEDVPEAQNLRFPVWDREPSAQPQPRP